MTSSVSTVDGNKATTAKVVFVNIMQLLSETAE